MEGWAGSAPGKTAYPVIVPLWIDDSVPIARRSVHYRVAEDAATLDRVEQLIASALVNEFSPRLAVVVTWVIHASGSVSKT